MLCSIRMSAIRGPARFRARAGRRGLRQRQGAAVRRLHDARGRRALSPRTSATRLSPLLWAGATRHPDAVAQPATDQFRRARPRTCRAWPGQGLSLLPALRQGALGRSLGGDLRLLHPPLPFETYGKKWTERKGQAGIHMRIDFNAPLMRGARRCSRTPCRCEGSLHYARSERGRPMAAFDQRGTLVEAAGEEFEPPEPLLACRQILLGLRQKRVGRWEETVPRSSAQGSCEPCDFINREDSRLGLRNPRRICRKARLFDECRRP